MNSKENQQSYLEQLLEVVEKDIWDTQMKLNSAEVNLRKLKDEQRKLLRELIGMERPGSVLTVGRLFDEEA